MQTFDLLVRGGTVVSPGGCERADIGVADGVIGAVGRDLEGGARATIDAAGLHVLPGVVDAHVHSPSRPELKAGENAFAAWGGIAGCQTFLRVLLTEAPRRGLPLEAIARLCADAPARRFRLDGKGSLVPGADADLALVDLRGEAARSASELLTRHRLSPFVGRTLRGRVVRTLVRGSTVCLGGAIVAPPGGRLARPRPGRAAEAMSLESM